MKPAVKAGIHALRKAGYTVHADEGRVTRHYSVPVTDERGVTVRVTLPLSPSDHRWLQNTLRDVRRKFREAKVPPE